jgi:hypothetical protein
VTLTFQLQTPRDALAKAHREFAALQAAVAAQDLTRIADCLYNFSVSVYHVRDWLIQGSPPACPKSTVDAFVHGTPALMACRDLCNASKHRHITQYVPVASTVLTSAPTSFVLTASPKPTLTRSTTPPFRVKVKMVNGQKFDVLTLGADALAAWDGFVKQHGV